LTARTGALWANLDGFKLVVYPFIEGHDGYAVPLSEGGWVEFGKAVRMIHETQLPGDLSNRIRREAYSPQWRDLLGGYLAHLHQIPLSDPLSEELAAYLDARKEKILALLERAGELALVLQGRSHTPVLCHSDLHAGNLLIAPSGAFYIVDWDEPIFAPKERDLMFPGSANLGRWRPPEEEETLFYRGYGPTRLDPHALAYYRTERIVADLAVECEIIFKVKESRQDRERELTFLKSNFQPGNTIDMVKRSDTA
jgi:spectinomycin phosphotransferase